MQNDETKKKQQPLDTKVGKEWERNQDNPPRRRRGPYGPIRNSRMQRAQRREG